MAKERYEQFLNETLQDYESKVKISQQRAEENARASEAYCSELKRQLQQALDVAVELQQKLSTTETELQRAREQLREIEDQRKRTGVPTNGVPADVGAFLSAMTCLTVTVEEGTDRGVIYTCQMDDGLIVGHKFTLHLNTSTWEYTYNPLDTSDQLPPDSFLASRLCFPDSMLSRFLLNLLKVSYSE